MLQISAGGKTTSLGDHDTEEEAARAFDRAAINKAGAGARTNFNIEEYKDEIADLQGKPPPRSTLAGCRDTVQGADAWRLQCRHAAERAGGHAEELGSQKRHPDQPLPRRFTAQADAEMARPDQRRRQAGPPGLFPHRGAGG